MDFHAKKVCSFNAFEVEYENSNNDRSSKSNSLQIVENLAVHKNSIRSIDLEKEISRLRKHDYNSKLCNPKKKNFESKQTYRNLVLILIH